MSSPTELIEQLRGRGIRDERVLNAIATVDRQAFVPESLADHAWDDSALPIAAGQTISQPYIVALMTEALALAGDEKVLEIGTGSGYQAAILSRLCRQVVTVERIEELSHSARTTLETLGIRGIDFWLGDGSRGCPEEAPFDGILVTAAAPDIPASLIDQLTLGGRLVTPIGSEELQDLVLVERTAEGLRRQTLCGCRFVKLIGEEGWRS